MQNAPDTDLSTIVERLRESGKRYVTGGQMGWFKRICKQLNEMESYM